MNYVPSPAHLNLRFSPLMNGYGEGILSGSAYDEAKVKHYAETVAVVIGEKKFRAKGKHGIKVNLNGIFIHKDVMYFRLRIENRTNIGYDVEQLRFFLRDEKKAKRTASQELTLDPLLIHQDTGKIDPMTGHSIVFAFPKFTIPDQKYLIVQMMEGNGGRHLELTIRNKLLMRTESLP